jgi:hypothetical protein
MTGHLRKRPGPSIPDVSDRLRAHIILLRNVGALPLQQPGSLEAGPKISWGLEQQLVRVDLHGQVRC